MSGQDFHDHEHGEIWWRLLRLEVEWGKSGVLEHKSDNISEMRKDRGNVTMEVSGTGEATDFKFGQNIRRVHPNKKPLKIFEKRERVDCGRIQGLLNFLDTPNYLRNW